MAISPRHPRRGRNPGEPINRTIFRVASDRIPTQCPLFPESDLVAAQQQNDAMGHLPSS
jgi:hypothetical protein